MATDDELTNALLRHSVDDLRRSVDELRKTVADYNVLVHRVTEVEKDVDEIKDRHVANRRLVFAALVAPAVLWVIQLAYAFISRSAI